MNLWDIPSTGYTWTDCAADDILTFTPGPTADYELPPLDEKFDYVEQSTHPDAVVLMTIDEVVGRGKFVPVELAEGLSDEDLRLLEQSNAVFHTAFKVRVDEVLYGDAATDIVVAEFGCLSAGQAAATTPGRQVFAILTESPQGSGPFPLLGANYVVRETLDIGPDGRLAQSPSLHGVPPIASYLIGLTVDEARKQIPSS